MYKEQIENYINIHKDEMIADIIEICKIDSQKREPKDGMPFGEGPKLALDMAMEMAKAYGFSVKNYDNYVCAIDLNDKEKQLDILAHLDVVPEGEGWQVCEPFSPKVFDGKIYGRGTSDDKGPAIAALFALRTVKELGIPLKKNTRLVLGTDEECGSSCLKYYYKKEVEAPMTFTPDSEYPVTNIEKGRLPGEIRASFTPDTGTKKLLFITAGTKINVVAPKAIAKVVGFKKEELLEKAGEVQARTGVTFSIQDDLEIIAIGANAHASRPADGNNAITALLEFLSSLDFDASEKIEIIRNLHRIFPHGQTDGENLGIKMFEEKSGELTLAFSMLEVKEDTLVGFFDTRIPATKEAQNILDICRENLGKAGVTFMNTTLTPPHVVDEDSAFIKTLLHAYEVYTGLKGECISTGGGTYVHDLKNGVAFGAVFPGTDTRMHGADEFAVIEELVTSAKIFAQVIVDLCM